MYFETAEGDRRMVRAAAEKLPSSTAWTKISISAARSIGMFPIYDAYSQVMCILR
jgi:hypothetical protein